MNLCVDDMNVGDWVVISYREPKVTRDIFGNERSEPYELNGAPLRIEAKNLPFMAVKDGPTGRVGTVNVRDFEFMRADPAYVKALSGDNATECDCDACRAKRGVEPSPEATADAQGISQEVIDKVGQLPCPNCGGRLSVHAKDGNLTTRCERCGTAGQGFMLSTK